MKNKFRFLTILTLTLAVLLFAILQVAIMQCFTGQLYIYSALNVLFFYFSTFYILNHFITLSRKSTRKFINSLKEENNQLKIKNEFYELVAKATSDTIWDWNFTNDDFTWNSGITENFGYKKDDVGTKLNWWFSKIHPEDSIKMSIRLYDFIAEKSDNWQDEYRFICADGSVKYILDRAIIIKNDDNKVVRIIGSMQDISKLKEEEQRLKLFETIIYKTKDIIMITEAENSEKIIPNIIFVNPAYKEITGYEIESVINKSPTDYLRRSSLRFDFRKIVEAMRKKEYFTFEVMNYKKNNEEYWLNVSMLPIYNNESKHSHWISIQRDITSEKHKQLEREQLINELTYNNNDLKQFSYIISHNLRAPISNLSGLLNLIEDIPIENTELAELISGFETSTNLLNETVTDLIKIIVIKDNPSIEKAKINIDEIVNNVCTQLASQLKKKQPIIKTNFEKHYINNINKSYFESIIMNLMTNALKYSKPNEQLYITIESTKTEKETTLLFKDNGIGINLEKNKDKVFGLYQKFHDFPDSKGLGLYLVKSQVETMGGTISIESEVNVGTTFKMIFKNK